MEDLPRVRFSVTQTRQRIKTTRRQGWLRVGPSEEENLSLKLHFGHPEREGMALPSPNNK